jgi:hypothetical protein
MRRTRSSLAEISESFAKARRQRDRELAACEAMSRFLVWVWCEAECRRLNVSRAFSLRRALEHGLLRLDWRRP